MEILLDETEAFQNMLVAIATTSTLTTAEEFARLREVVVTAPVLAPLLPRYLRTCRDGAQFWQFIKHKFPTYAERRTFIWDSFQPMLELLERRISTPSDDVVTNTLKQFDSANVQAAWAKALERRTADPEGAITMARTLLESVCHHVLEETNVQFSATDDLPNLYSLVATHLNIAPSQHTEQVFKQILGSCMAVVQGLGTIRNRLSDSHGRGKSGVKPAPRHAELAVNIAGTLATFILATKAARAEKP